MSERGERGTPSEPTPRYRLGPRSTRGLIAGWRPGQIVVVAVGCILAVGALRSVGGAGGALLALIVAGAALASATWPIGGRTAEEWVPTAARFGAQLAVRTGEAAAVSGSLRPWGSGRRRRGPLSRLRLEQLESSLIGVVIDDESGMWTGVMAVGGAGFALLDEAQRADRIAAWSGVLAAVAHDGGGLHRLQWVARTLPAYLIGTAPELPEGDGDGTGGAAEEYADLLAAVGPELWAREVLVAVTVRVARGGRPSRSRAGTGLALARQLELVGDRIRSAGLACGPPLTIRQLAQCLSRSFATAPVDEPAIWPWPVGVDDGWAALRTDDSWHATYWIAEWPRSDVPAGWLLPLVVAGGLRHTVSVTMAPLQPAVATRRAERERTSGTADAELRRRHGYVLTARARREQDARQQREVELAEGHAGYRFSGYVTVTDSDPAELARACLRVEQAAAISQVEMRRLYGAQEGGFCCGLPIGRGCAVR